MVAGDSSARDGGAGVKVVRPILVWPWNENARAKQKQQTNGNGAIWLVCRTVTNVRGFWLVKRTLGWKNFMLEKPSRNQPILRFDIILQHDWPIEQRLLHIRVFFGGKTKRPCFDLFIHWAIKQITIPKRFFKVIRRKSLLQNSSGAMWTLRNKNNQIYHLTMSLINE